MSFMSKIKSATNYVNENKAELALYASSIATTAYVVVRTHKDPIGAKSLGFAWMAGFMGGTLTGTGTNAFGLTDVSEGSCGFAGAAAAVIAHEAFVHGGKYINKVGKVAVDTGEFIGDVVVDSSEMIA